VKGEGHSPADEGHSLKVECQLRGEDHSLRSCKKAFPVYQHQVLLVGNYW